MVTQWFHRLLLVALLGTASAAACAEGNPAPVKSRAAYDAVILIDNTLSMRASDSQGGVKKVVLDFVKDCLPSSRIEVALYDETVDMLQPLRHASSNTPLSIQRRLTYRGRYANLPSALERATYDLKIGGRPGTQKAVLILTDSGVDTGDSARDQNSIRWLMNEFARDAASQGILIYAVALSDKADFQLLHALATTTQGDYLRAYTANDLGVAMQRIQGQLNERSRALEAMVTNQATEGLEDGNPIPMLGYFGRALASPLGLLLLALCAGLVAYLVGQKPVVRRSDDDFEPLVFGSEAVAERVPPAEMCRLDGGKVTERIKLVRPFTVVGRVTPLANTKVGHLRLDSQAIGRCHALIEYRGSGFWIVDKKSLNGTFVNDHRVTGEQRLKHGDRVRFHLTEFEFALPEMEVGDETLVIPQLGHEGPLELPRIGHFSLGEEEGKLAQRLDETPMVNAARDQRPDRNAGTTSATEDLGFGEDEQSITRLLSQLNTGPIVDPEFAAGFESTTDTSRPDLESLQETNSELDILIRDYMGVDAAVSAPTSQQDSPKMRKSTTNSARPS